MKVILFAALVCLAAATAPLNTKEGPDAIEGEYIVVFKTNTDKAAAEAHYASLKLGEDESIMFKYAFGDFSGYSAKLNKDTLSAVLEDSLVKYVDQNAMAHAMSCETQANLPAGLWGLGRSVSRTPGNTIFTFNPTRGQAVDAYITDTGIFCEHQTFQNRQGRCTHGFDATNEGPGDGNGHGTHVAGTVAGNTYGFCRNCEVIAVKVLGRGGSGSWAGVIAGINYITNRHGSRPSVNNMSLGGGFQQSVNDATDASVRAGVVQVAASGNSNTNACTFSPASAPLAIAVNSMQNNDARSSFSNFGTCTQIFAPGTNILSSWIGSNTATSTISGTSMAAPHVAGVIAELLSEPGRPRTPAGILQDLIEDSTKNVITNPGAGSPNTLVFHACVD